MKTSKKETAREDFLVKLQHQASLQAPLNEHRWLPKQIDPVTSFIGNYPWQTLLIISGVTALLMRL